MVWKIPASEKGGMRGRRAAESPESLNTTKSRQFFGPDTLNFLPGHRHSGYVQATCPLGFTYDPPPPPNTQILNPPLSGLPLHLETSCLTLQTNI